MNQQKRKSSCNNFNNCCVLGRVFCREHKHIYLQHVAEVKASRMILRNMQCHSFYLFEIPESRRFAIIDKIHSLGGTVVDSIRFATQVLIIPSEKKLPEKTLFKLLTAAIGGRVIVPASYIMESFDEKRFLNIKKYCSLAHFKAKFDLSLSTLAAVKISIHYRSVFAKKQNPAFYQQNILFALPEGQYEDVKLLLEFSGATVQPCYRHNTFFKNQLFTMCVTDGTVELHDFAAVIPQVTPDAVRNILWRTYKNFL